MPCEHRISDISCGKYPERIPEEACSNCVESKERALHEDIILFPWIAYGGNLKELPTASILAFIAHLEGILLERMEDQP